MNVHNLSSDHIHSKNVKPCSAQLKAEMSLTPLPTVLVCFPFAGIHASTDVYALFRFDPMHKYLLGMSRMIIECA